MVKRILLSLLCAYGAMSCSSPASDRIGSDKACVGCDSTAESPRSGLVSTDFDIPEAPASVDTADMVFIPGQTFLMGASDTKGRADEYPQHYVSVSPFWMATHEVTNAEFRAFVEATGYVTIAERDVDWEQLKSQVPPGTPKPADSLLLAGSLIFNPPGHAVDLNDFTQWWSWKTGADWRHPHGPASNIEGLDQHPVVQVCWFDAMAYCQWAGVRLPTEAEWECAARAGRADAIYAWGTEFVEAGNPKANAWQGGFPYENRAEDGFAVTAPVGSFAPNPYGLYDMSGNVWEWCSDWYAANYYAKMRDTIIDPQGPEKSYDPRDPYGSKRAQRGGSYLCNEEYCSSYRVSARMPGSEDTGMPHAGFRVVVSATPDK